MKQELAAIEVFVGNAILMDEGGMPRYIRIADAGSYVHGNVLLGVDLPVLNLAAVGCIVLSQLRSIAHRRSVCHGFAMLPHGGNQVAGEIGRSCSAIVDIAVLVGQHGLEYVDAVAAGASLLGDRTSLIGRNRHGNAVSAVTCQVSEAGSRNLIAVLVCNHHVDVHIRVLPGFKAIILRAQVQ